MRICTKCKEPKDISDFSERLVSKDGYNRKCKTCVSFTKKLWEKNNKDKVIASRNKRKYKLRESRKLWNINNPEYSKNYKRKYSRSKRLQERMSVDEVLKSKIKIKKSISSSIKRYANNNKCYTKQSITTDILGCDFEFFKKYIESKFESWMNWSNYGKYNNTFNYGWDFDHIIPLNTAQTVDAVYKLNHYTNFQPLCSKINRDIKRDNINLTI